LLDSRNWREAHEAAKLPFHLDGDAVPATRTNSRRSWISTADGVVCRAGQGELWIEKDADEVVSLKHSVSRSFELNVLLGRRVRVALLHVSSADAGLTQTLTISDNDANPLLIAHAGEARGLSHWLGSTLVYVALSQRHGGPMVFGTSRVQSIVRAGDHIRVRDDDETYVMEFESRRGTEANYAIGIEDMWNGTPSTLR
jgi:hypothetical protein